MTAVEWYRFLKFGFLTFFTMFWFGIVSQEVFNSNYTLLDIWWVTLSLAYIIFIYRRIKLFLIKVKKNVTKIDEVEDN